MLRGVLLSIERVLPAGAKRLGQMLYASLPPSIRYGRAYGKAVRLLGESQFWSREQLESYQLGQLKRIVQHAYENSPFYTELFDSRGFTPPGITTLEDLRRLPTVSKDDVRARTASFKAVNFPPSKFQYHTTGGSTGIPLGLYWESDRTVALERAFMRRQFEWIGFRMDQDRSIALRGIPVLSGEKFERVPGKQIRFSSYDLTPEVMDEFMKLTLRFKPVALMAYPSAASIVAQHIIERGKAPFGGLDAVLCGSENVYGWQRKLIEYAFGCRLYSWYGQSEYVSLAGECEVSTDYHVYSEYGITEVLLPNGTPASPGEVGEIVATGFNNFAFPLIRYRTGDLARVSTRTGCACGRHYDLLESIEGRLQEMIVGKRGNLVSMTAINMHTDIFDRVRQFQFLQTEIGKLGMKIIRRHGYTHADEARILRDLEQKLRDDFEVQISYVDHIPLTPRGKATFLIQELDLPGFPDQQDRV